VQIKETYGTAQHIGVLGGSGPLENQPNTAVVTYVIDVFKFAAPEILSGPIMKVE
jgi:hypothetical protein